VRVTVANMIRNRKLWKPQWLLLRRFEATFIA
jgi:hypothetical protein